jgi:transcriptional regulator with XRE-family HTH domain
METANFGTFLKEERERRRVSLREISQATKLSVSSLQHMESGNLDDLPPEIFVRGFIRSYARTLGISSSEPLELLDQTLLERRRADEPIATPDLRAYRAPLAVRPSRAPMDDGMPDPPVEDEGQSPRHGIGLAVFVIIVLLIATITLSLFLRQQPQSGEGLSLEDGASQTVSPLRRV